MTKKRWLRMASGLAALCLVLAAVAWAATPTQEVPLRTGGALRSGSADLGPTPAAPGSDQAAESDRIRPGNDVIVITADAFDESPALRDIPSIEPVPQPEVLLRWNETSLHPEDGSFDGVDVGLQAHLMNGVEAVTAMPAPIANFAGVNNVNGVLPPDTQGDVGPNHYVQWVNLAYAVYDKAGNKLLGPSNGNTLWTGFSGSCATKNDGDPITIYDYVADRWMMSQFQVNSTGSSYQCIAISTTPDPTGSWYRYQFTWPNNLMNDYPHFGLWPDAYYMTANQFIYSTGAWRGAGVAAFEREKMLTGQPAQMVYFSLYSQNADYGGQLPADMDGATPPPAGAPGLIMEWDDSSWLGTANDALRIWKFHVDWTTPGNSYLGTGAAGTAGSPNWTINTNNVDPTVCSGSSRSCIDQPGTTAGLDAISDRLMYRLQYRNFGGHQVLVGNHTVDTNNPAGVAGIHWFELRNTGADWAMHQQGTYGLSDSLSRWMGSIAMDGSGNIALGYSVSGATVYPGIRYVGRLASDTPGIMGQSETTLINGGGYQSHSAARWGDYSAMQVDPTDDATFWFTTEYMATSSSAGWVTRIGSFKFGSANQPPVAGADAYNTAEDTPLSVAAPGVLSNDSDPNGGTLSVSGNTQPAHGSATVNANGSLTYTPAANYNGADSFTYTLSDGQGGTATGTVNLTVTAVNDAPVASAQAVSTAANTPLGITLTGSDVDGDPLTFTVATQPTLGALSGTAPNLTYTPNGTAGSDSFTFTVSDGQVTSAPATVSITVTAVNHAPVANPQSVATNEDTALAITLTASDQDGNPLTYAVATQPAHGALSGTAPNLTYTPAANYNGPDSFTFTANDGQVTSAPATVSITVNPVNDAPVANPQTLSTPVNTALPITLTGSDADGNPLTYTVVTQPALGTLSGTAPNLTYTSSSAGSTSFTFKVNDGTVDSAVATVSITVSSGVTNTGWKAPTANAAVTSGSGDNNGFQTTPANAYASDNAYAVDTNSGTGASTSSTSTQKDRHIFNNYGFSIPTGATILGISVRLEAKTDGNPGAPRMYVELSANGGATWTTGKATATLTRSDVVYTLGGTADLWGAAWTSSAFTDANFRVRIVDVASNINRDFSLDQLTVMVTYQ